MEIVCYVAKMYSKMILVNTKKQISCHSFQTQIPATKYKHVPLNSLTLWFLVLRSHNLIVPSEDAEYTRFSSSGLNLEHSCASNQNAVYLKLLI
jgi:hypothetical protein